MSRITSSVEQSPRQTELLVRGWMEKARRKFLQPGTVQFMAGAVSTLVAVRAANVHGARAEGGGESAPIVSSLDVRSEASEQSALSVDVSPEFSLQHVSPERLARGFENVFGPSFAQNVNSVVYVNGHILMPAAYRGRSRYEAGHCTRSPRRGERSQLVLTQDAFGHRPIATTLRVAIHEGGHSMDPENDETMPEPVRSSLRNALQIIVEGDRVTIYSYVNAYQGGSATKAVEDGIQREELFAELMADALTMSPLNPDDPLLRQPVRDRLSHRLSVTHGIPLDEAQRYGAVLGLVADVRGENFFEDGQRAAAALAHDLAESRRAGMIEETQQSLYDALERSPLPTLSVALRHSFHREAGQGENPARNTVDHLRLYRNYFAGNPVDSTNPADLVRRIEEAIHTLQVERQAYNEEFLRGVFDQGLRSFFIKLTAPAAKGLPGGPLVVLQDAVAHLPLSRDEGEVRVWNTRIEGALPGIQSLLWMAEHEPDVSLQQREEFRSALLRWVELEGQGRFYTQVVEHHPELTTLTEEAHVAFQAAVAPHETPAPVIQVYGNVPPGSSGGLSR